MQLVLVQLIRQRPTQTRFLGPLQIVGNGAARQLTAVGNLAIGELGLVFEAKTTSVEPSASPFREDTEAGLSSVAVISAHGGHRFRPPPKSGHFQTETGGHFAPNWVATLDRNEWPLCSEIRNGVLLVRRT